ncbi:MAG: DUF4126 domain-containing protein [Terrimicrobiaceae bacterium]
MDIIEMLSVALGLATLAGINLYLTVFVTGLSVHLKWVVLPDNLEQLGVLADPWVIGVSAVLYVLEFFADKVPWIDSLNDSVHTVIRPVGGALLAVLALGEADPAAKVVAALLAGGVALTSHTAKAGARLLANTSPEPVSNVALSLGEDVVVLGGLGLLVFNPVIAGILAVVLLGIVWAILPRILRSIRATTWLAWRKLNNPADHARPRSQTLPSGCERALRRAHATQAPIKSAVFCLSGAGPRLAKNHSGWLVTFEGEPSSAFFVAPGLWGPMVVEIPTHGMTAERKSKFLSEVLTLSGEDSQAFHFERGHYAEADRLAQELQTSEPNPALQPSESHSEKEEVLA